MGKTNEDKLLRYIKLGKLHRVRSLVKKRKIVDINSVSGGRGRTPLHISCLLGDDAIVRLLLKCGADPQAQDNDGNTPLHLALKYALQTTRTSAYSDLILPLLKSINEQETFDLRNSEGASASELLSKLKESLRTRREERKIWEEEETRKHEEHLRRREEENNWRSRIRYEAESESISCEDYMNDYSDDDIESQSYDDWVEKIRITRSHKQRDMYKDYRDAREKRRKQQEAAKERTRVLEEEHQAYIDRISMKRKQTKLATRKADYEIRCQEIFSDKTISSLTFKDIPWPCDGSAVENGEMLLSWAEFDEDGKKKFMKGQQVRWHPDRFVQRCGDRLVEHERDSIMDQVKGISQQINALLAKL